MDQKLTEEQQWAAHKIIKANRGDCAYKGNYLNCWDCPRAFESSRCEGPLSKEFQAENLRRSQAWLDEHITDAEIMVESPQEFCERMVRTGMCGRSCDSCAECAKDYWATHKITPQEPAKRRPTPEEMVVEPKPVANAPKPEAKEKGDTTVKGDVDKLPLGLLHLINFRDLLPTDALRIIALEGQVDDLTKKLTASKKLCERQQRRLRASWEAKRDGEMATREEIIAWFDAGKGTAIINGSASRIRLMNRTDWIPATRGNLKL